ncbi:hypothetical protein THAOC_37428, partial [Thalassiosira oceanica]
MAPRATMSKAGRRAGGLADDPDAVVRSEARGNLAADVGRDGSQDSRGDGGGGAAPSSAAWRARRNRMARLRMRRAGKVGRSAEDGGGGAGEGGGGRPSDGGILRAGCQVEFFSLSLVESAFVRSLVRAFIRRGKACPARIEALRGKICAVSASATERAWGRSRTLLGVGFGLSKTSRLKDSRRKNA